MYRLAVLLACMAAASARLQLNGTCDRNVVPMLDFRIGKFEGTWYLVESLGDDNLLGECPAMYLSKYSRLVASINRGFKENGEVHRIGGFADTTDAGTFNMNELPFTMKDSNRVPFKVLDAEYDSYALMYYCKQDTPNTKTVYAMKFSSERTLSGNYAAAIDSIVDVFPELRNGPWKKYDQTGCEVFSG